MPMLFHHGKEFLSLVLMRGRSDLYS